MTTEDKLEAWDQALKELDLHIRHGMLWAKVARHLREDGVLSHPLLPIRDEELYYLQMVENELGDECDLSGYL